MRPPKPSRAEGAEFTMSLCRNCYRGAWWPYAIALFVSVFAAFLTGLTLHVVETPPPYSAGWIVGAFIAVFTLLSRYMKACLQRHCGHQQSVLR